MVLNISADNTNTIKWYVDEEFALQTCFKGITGMEMTVVQGVVISVS